MKLQIIFLPTASLLADANLRSPALQHMLAVGQHAALDSSHQALLCRMMGIARQTDWPIAPFSWLGEAGERDGAYWLCADPVHLILQRDYFSLSEPVPLAVAPQDAQALVASLNQHFAAEGLQFHIGNSGRWYLRLESPPAISTSLPEAAMGRDTRPRMPQGAGMAKWNRLVNEMQMLLFEHPVNQAREARGELAINSIWLSGGGVLAEPLATGDNIIFADGPLAKGLASVANAPCIAVPESAAALLYQAKDHQAKGDQYRDDVILVLDSARAADSLWFAPLLQSLRRREITQLSINFAVRDQVLQVLVKPADRWKFWRKTRPLGEYFHG